MDMTAPTITGLTSLQEYGLAGLFLSFILIGGVIAIRYFASHCEKRTEAVLTAYKDEAHQNRLVIEKNTEAFHGVQMAIVELKGKVEK